MQKSTFDAGVSPGGLRDAQEIKILVCYVLYKLDKPVKKSDITSILQNYELANYFEVSQAFSEMVANNNIAPDSEDKNCFVITDSGKMIVEELSRLIPASVREKALKSADMYFKRLKSEEENKVIIRKNSKGYYVTCKVPGGGIDMLELKIYAPDMIAACNIKNNFYSDPELLYSSIISILTRSQDYYY